ncbi:M3 family metallopeptidase [bacterium]|nr:M3 family metallopeptidase [bacterium]
MKNPLLDLINGDDLPPFSHIKPDHAEPALDAVLAENRAAIADLEDQDAPTWDSLPGALEQLDNRLHRLFAPVGHLNAVMNSPEWRDAYNACLPKLSEFGSEVGQNRALFESFQRLRDSDEFSRLSAAQQQTIDNALRDFRLSGVALEGEARGRYREIQQRLSALSAKFDENVLDATQGWTLQFDNAEALAGLPQRNLEQAAEAARSRDQSGYVVTLDFPSYNAVMTYATDRAMREQVYTAFATRASDQGPQAGQWDNAAIIEETLALRHERANLLGYANHGELSLATKMADSPQAVLEFLDDLAQRSRPLAQRELEELTAFAKRQDGLETLQPWDVTYYAEQLKQQKLGLSDEMLRPYFEAKRVLTGMLDVASKLYGVRFEPVDDVDVWHDDVQVLAVIDADSGARRGLFYLDPYARANKRGGAWMDDCQGRFMASGASQMPVAFLVCNFGRGVGDAPSLLSHDEVLTLFHEFGHGLHHLLTQVDVLSVSGIAGVPWDAVELPSQFMENWAYEREALDGFARHFETGEPIPDDLLAKLQASRRWHAGLGSVRQLEFALFDFKLHMAGAQSSEQMMALLREVHDTVAVLPMPDWHRFPMAFSHIFAGGYAAGYYSYKWAELMAADAFSAFEDAGVFDAETGARFRDTVLAQGGSRPIMDVYKDFRGREPEPDALLRQMGLDVEIAA